MKPAFFDKIPVRVLMTIIGILMMVVAYNFFFIPNKIAPGGFSGIGTLLYYSFGFPVGVVTLILNVPLFLVALKQQGWGYIVRSLAATVFFSVTIDLLPVISVTHDLLLASVYGGVLVGVGLAMVIRAGCSTGGSDMLALLISEKFPRVSFGVALFVIEFLIVSASGVVFGPQSALYAVLIIFMTSKLIDILQEGLNSAKALFIITVHGNVLSQRILLEMKRGVTSLSGTGMYSGAPRDVLLCIIHRSELLELKNIIKEEDPQAFVIVTDVREAMGEGFMPFQKSTKKPL